MSNHIGYNLGYTRLDRMATTVIADHMTKGPTASISPKAPYQGFICYSHSPSLKLLESAVGDTLRIVAATGLEAKILQTAQEWNQCGNASFKDGNLTVILSHTLYDRS